MGHVKTAISLPELLLASAEAVANEMKVSRSKLMAIALEEFLKRYHNQQLLAQINATYTYPDEEEQKLISSMRRHHRQILEGEW